MIKIVPLQDKVLLKKIEEKPKEEVVKGGIIIPSDGKAIIYGEVVDISKGKDFEMNEDKYVLISYKEISGIIEF